MHAKTFLSKTLLVSLFVVGGAAFFPGCGSSDVPAQSATTATYHQDIKPLLDRYCTSCHRDGDIAPFTLTDYDGVKNHAALIKPAVESGRMPPWMPSDAGLALRYDRKLAPADKQQLLDWLAAGAPVGDPSSPPRSDFPPAEAESPPRPDLVLKAAQPYMPDVAMADDYRCFVFDPKNDRDRFVVAGQFNPDNRAIDHHMALYLISPAQAAQVRAMDGGAGYPCIAGPGNNIAGSLVLAWAPGGTSMRTPMGTAFRVPKGAVFVMQMHFSAVATNGKPDHSNVTLELDDTAPSRELMAMFAVKPDIAITAGDANSKQTVTYQVSKLGAATSDVLVYGAFPHMHLLGRRIALSQAGGPMLIEIPKWDFHWQNDYSFVTPIALHPSDVVQLECDYDNSAANQPVIMGQQKPPQDVHWGESTLDEMCALVLTAAVK